MEKFILILLSFLSTPLFSQINSGIVLNKPEASNFEYMHGYGLIGLSYLKEEYDLTQNDTIVKFNGIGIGLVYNARYNFSLTEDIGISINAYPYLGFLYVERPGLGFEMPIMAQLNFWRYSNRESISNVGAQIGFGYGVGGSTTPFFYHGISAIAGVTFGFGYDKSLSINAKYQNAGKKKHFLHFTFIYNFSG